MGLFRRSAAGLVGSRAPELKGITGWVNTEPFALSSLRGSVVLLEIWTFDCINCVRTLPGLRDLYERYRDRGVEIVGVHTPEFEHERGEAAVRAACERLGVTWPVAVDDAFEIWNAYANRFWPHLWVIDRTGTIRAHFVGEGHDRDVVSTVESLLSERSQP